MALNVHTVLILIALVCFALAALGVGTGRVNAIAVGLFCWLASTVF
jgi:hypothetical protein